MENLACNRSIDEQIEMVYDELKSYIECLTCCDTIHHNILIREARFEHAMSDLKYLVWEKLRNKNVDTPPKKQAKIIFYEVDQCATCFIENENGDAQPNNPYQPILKIMEEKGDYYGLSIQSYKKLLEEDGYEWVLISHSGSSDSKVLSKSDGYVFKGKYKNLKVGDKYYNCCGDIIRIKK